MEQNVQKCKDCIKKIKRLLEDNGYSIIVIDDDILCKTPRKSTLNRASSISNNANCQLLSACGGSQSKMCQYTTCPYTACSVSKKDCPLLGGNANTGNSSGTTTGNAAYSANDCLFRIIPTDIYNGIFLHAIFIRGEHCDLKMTFDYDTQGPKEVVDVINFLVG